MNLPRSSYYYKPKRRELSPEEQAIIARIVPCRHSGPVLAEGDWICRIPISR
ncbi:MAG TPA: hypothetical protein VLX29_08145 [Nitrospirota bacterium]|nr:hypothetical protein [Nitrospirota bacterium]